MNQKKSGQDMLRELLCGNLLVFLLGEGIILLMANHKWSFSLWFFLGICFSCLWVMHIRHTIEVSMMLEEKEALIAIRKASFMRWGFFVLVFVTVSVLRIGNVIAFFLGVFALKVSAYLQPMLHGIFLRAGLGGGKNG